MNLKDVRNLIAFHYWARNHMLDAVDLISTEQFTREVGGSFGSIRNTLVHTLWAERIWLSRWKGKPQTEPLVPESFPDVAAVRHAWTDVEVSLRALFDAMDEDGIRRVVPYRSLAGVDTESILWHMLQHVVNHASYHRGQVTTLLRQLGAAPPKSTDLIFFYRENPQL